MSVQDGGLSLKQESDSPEHSQGMTTQPATRPHWTEITSVAINLVLAIAAIVALYIYHGQLTEMRKATKATQIAAEAARDSAKAATDTLKEIRAGGTDTHDLAVQAKNQADATKTVADRALAQTNATNELARQAKRSADATQSALSVGRDNLQLARSALRIQERPWMAITRTVSLDGGTFKAKSVASNSGKSPAFQVTCRGRWSLRPPQPLLPAMYTDDVTRTIVMPGGTFETSEAAYTPETHELNKITQGFQPLYYFGEVEYEDVFTSENTDHKPHITHFCGFWEWKSKKMWDCPFYNGAD